MQGIIIMWRPRWVALTWLLLAVVAGCGQQNSQRATLSGLVTMDDNPLAQGSILCIPVDGNRGVTTGGTITDGRYALTGSAGPAIGPHKIEIRSVRKSGRMIPKPLAPPGEMVDAGEEAVAEQFNSRSTLRIDVEPGENAQNFTIKSRPMGKVKN